MNFCRKITIIGINFYPEDTAIGLYSTQMAEYLQESGFQVSVVTGFPYYPQWKIWEGYKDKPKYLEEEYKGIKIYRYKQFTPVNLNFKNRVKHILDFTLGSWKNIRKISEADLIMAVVPFTSDVWLAYKLAKKTKAKVWVHVQDFEFDTAFEAGIIRKNIMTSLMSKFLFWYEKRLFDKADVLSTISYSMFEKAKKKTETEIFYFPNWIDENFINPEKANIHPYLKSHKFKILYAGNIGDKQDWETYMKIVENFKNKEDIEFIIVGDGAKRSWLMEKVNNFKNVKYYPPVPYEKLPDLLCNADLHILFQKPDVIDSVMPSKIIGMLASAKPSLVVGNRRSEVAKVLKESQGGEFLGNNDIDKISEFIEKLNNERNLIGVYGGRAREYVVKYYSKNRVLNKLKNKINELISK